MTITIEITKDMSVTLSYAQETVLDASVIRDICKALCMGMGYHEETAKDAVLEYAEEISDSELSESA